ncbi:MAG: glycosyltransferase family 39 protein [Hyphomicrobiales bacterium]
MSDNNPLFDRETWSGFLWPVVLVLVTLLCVAPGFFSIPPVDRDETRFAQASRQMIETNDFVDIRYQDGTRYKKPIGIYWLQTASVKLLQTTSLVKEQAPIWAYRLPSAIGVVLAVLLTYAIACVFLPSSVAGIAALFMAISVLPGFEARIAKTDGVLLAVILAAQLALARAYTNKDGPLSLANRILFWGSLGVGLLIKGPIIILVSGLTVAALSIYQRSFALIKRLKPLTGLLLTLLIAVPWFVAIGIKSEGVFFIEAGLVDFLGKVASVKESHGGVPGIYASIMIGTFWPSSLVFLVAIPFLFKQRRSELMVFCLCWAVPSWIVFELTPTKLPHYVLPLYPALAVMIAFAVQEGFKVERLWQKILLSLLFVAPLVLSLVVVVGLIFIEGYFAPIAVLFGAFAAFAGFFAWRKIVTSGNVQPAVGFLAASAFCLYLAVYQFGFPNLQSVWISNNMVTALNAEEERASCSVPRTLSVGYHEPSLAFLGPLDIRFVDEEGAADKLAAEPCRRLFVVDSHLEDTSAALEKRGFKLKPLSTVQGVTLNGGNKVQITLNDVLPLVEASRQGEGSSASD